ncbi:2'-deoxycytidine 5'-triphosphate deaminase [Ponticaulis sp.]|uniref:2'-deoxycytidine 5'-triphosphate deaminase domain-containing protein n=1 Tax=Ponticaulis sp. TaxID=2020902 RepID=UPI0025D7405D|nr:2'-deoxycytidine 5'-triphosphate deaminase [Ponticaulis sp.]
MSFPDGILADHQIEAAIANGMVRSDAPFAPLQVQPASIDLRLGTKAYRLRASFLPNGRTVEECLTDDIVMHTVDLSNGAVLETGCVYLVPLQEYVSLPEGVTATANPKSSTGRIDVFVRLIADGVSRFDGIPEGYDGPLYAEVSPRTYSVLARPGDRLLQMRFRSGEHTPTNSLDFSIHLEPLQDGLIGYRARRHARVLDLSRVGGHRIDDYWEPVFARNGRLILDPDEFYILASKEFVTIPVDRAAEMAPTEADVQAARDKLKARFEAVRTGGAGTVRRKKLKKHASHAADEKQLQQQLKRLGVNNIPGVEEVNMFKEDGSVLHFATPKVQASVAANTYTITGHGDTKRLEELLPGIINQLGPDNLMNLKRIAEAHAAAEGAAGAPAEEDDIPDIGENFEDVSKA